MIFGTQTRFPVTKKEEIVKAKENYFVILYDSYGGKSVLSQKGPYAFPGKGCLVKEYKCGI